MFDHYLSQFCTHLAVKAVFVIEEQDKGKKRPSISTYYYRLLYNRLNKHQHQGCRQKVQPKPSLHYKGIWLDEKTGLFYCDDEPIPSFSPLDAAILTHLLRHPEQRQTYTEIIFAAWPDTNCGGVSTDCLYQAVRRIRRQIEPIPSRPRYLLNWRGRPEGGYLIFPTGSSPLN